MFPELQHLAPLLVAQAPQGGCAGGQEQLLLPIIMFAILYFVWIRPASKERKTHAEMLKNLKRGDKVVTTSGMIGTIADKSEETLTVEVARNVKIEMLKSAIAKRVKTPEELAAAGKKPDSGKKPEASKKSEASKKPEAPKKPEPPQTDGGEPAKKKG